jgi:hypothetical protein
MWIDGIIEEYPDCRFLHEGDDGLVCGEEYPCGCFIDHGADALDGCSLLKYTEALPSFWKIEDVRGRYEILTGRHRYVKDGQVFDVDKIDGYLFARINMKLAEKIGGDIVLKEPISFEDIDAYQTSLFGDIIPGHIQEVNVINLGGWLINLVMMLPLTMLHFVFRFTLLKGHSGWGDVFFSIAWLFWLGYGLYLWLHGKRGQR